MEQYEVYFGNKPSGKVQVHREGLYYRFSCRCRLTGEVVCRLWASCGGKEENLGVVVPMDGCFGLDKKIPVKHLGEGKMVFTLRPKHDTPKGRFVPIYPDEPFAYIERIKEGYLARKGGQAGVVLPD